MSHVALPVTDQVRRLLSESGSRQIDLAQHLGIKQPSLSAKLNGKTPLKLSEVYEIAHYFGLPVTALFDSPTTTD